MAKKAIILVLIIMVSLIYRKSLFEWTWIDQYISYSMYPILVLQSKLIDPIKTWHAHHLHYNNLVVQMNNLKKEYDSLLAHTIELSAMATYYDDIYELQSFKKRYDYARATTVRILMRHCADDGHYILVDAGTSKGIQRDMVAVYKNCLVGRVDEVYPWYSKIRLITDPRCKVAAYCTTTHAQGIHQGINNRFQTELCYVSHLQSVNHNDLVLSSGEGLVFPQGFGLGRIAATSTNGLHHQITIKPLIDVMTLQYCVVIAKADL